MLDGQLPGDEASYKVTVRLPALALDSRLFAVLKEFVVFRVYRHPKQCKNPGHGRLRSGKAPRKIITRPVNPPHT